MTEHQAGGGSGDAFPTGIVTFLFTDVEGSTRLVQVLGGEFAELLATHDALIRGAVADHRGVEVRTEGDAFFVVFTSPQAALAAAVEAQRALSEQDWPQGSAVRVRMGLHTGEGRLGGDNYVGLDVHLAARIAGAAHGGQILVSDATRTLGEASPVVELGFRDLGSYRLKDFDQPVRLHQVIAGGLATEFPLPRGNRLGRLPTPRTSFVGRRETLDELRSLLGTARLLVLTGPGGAGKTRLAVELARSVSHRYADGAFFVALDAITEARFVPSAILEVMEIAGGTSTADAAMHEALAGMEVLLVLDNVEQIPDIGGVIDELLEACPALTVLTTSRVALRVYGEQEYQVLPLALPGKGHTIDPSALVAYEGVALFVERARSSRPGFQVTPANAQAITEICRRLDGLPLAIELAVGRLRMLTPDLILARLDERLKLLEDRAPNLPARQRSIRAAIEWSYALLGEEEQRLMNRLGVFVGGWDLRAAEAVCDIDGDLGLDVLDGMGSLLDQSLIVRQDDATVLRFGMLQTIQEYARERLAVTDEEAEIALRHAGYFRQLVEAAEPEFVGADPGACVARLTPDLDNVRAALNWTLSTGRAETGLAIGAAGWRLWQLRGQLSEGRRYLEDLLGLPDAREPNPVRARALTALGGILYWQSDPGSRERYEEARAIYDMLGDEAGLAESSSNLGFAALTGSPADPELARSHFMESLRRYESLGDRRMMASLTGSIGYSEMVLGRLDEARQALERALELNVEGGYRGRAADNRFALGNLHRGAEDFSRSAAMYSAALADALEMRDSARTLTYLFAIASWATHTGRLADGVRLGGAVAAVTRERGGGTLTGVASIVDPIAAALERGLAADVVAAEREAGELLGIEEAVDFAFGLLDDAAVSPGDGD